MSITIDWEADFEEFESLSRQCPRFNLLQSRAWGLVKQTAEGWTPHCAVVRRDGRPAALVQILSKRFGPFAAARLNRGPVWLEREPDAELAALVFTALRRRWGWRNLGMLSAAPGLEECEDNQKLLAACGYRRRGGAGWSTAWVDLSPGPDELRKKLNAKWRNKLKAAERNDLQCEVLEGRQGMDWLMPLYESFQDSKGFSGISRALLDDLAEREPGMMKTYRVSSQERAASGVLIIGHGTCATYAVGWNSDVGRESKANYLALWRAIEDLCAQDMRYLDLGGIDAVNTPGIAEFKTRLNGEPQVLVGEFWAF